MGFGSPGGINKQIPSKIMPFHSICPRMFKKIKLLQRKVWTLMTILIFLVLLCIETVGWHCVTNGFGVPSGD